MVTSLRVAIAAVLMVAASKHATSAEAAFTEDTATTRARTAFGLVDPQVVTAASEVKSPEKLVPSIAVEDTAWKVDFDNVKIAVHEQGREKANPYVERMTCFLSPKTGQVIKIESQWPDKVPGTRFPDIAAYEQQMKSITQSFTGLPTTPPKISLMQAIQRVNPGTIAIAKQIVAYYLMETNSKPKIEPRAVWVIHAWGIPAFPPHIPLGGSEADVPVDQRNHLRFIVNAETGESYGADTIPQPVTKVSSAPELKPHARGAAGTPSSARAGDTPPNVPTLTLAVSPCYFHVQGGKAIYGWPHTEAGRGNQEREKVEVKIGFGATVSLSGTHQIKRVSPDAQGVHRTKEGRLVATEGVTAPFISAEGVNQPNARTASYTQVIDNYIVPLPVAAEMVIGPRVYEVDGVRLETKGVVLRHVPSGKFEACCVSSEDFRAGKEAFVSVAFMRNPPDMPNRVPNGPRASIEVRLDGNSVTITTGGGGATSGVAHDSAFAIFSPERAGTLSVKAQYGAESCTIDLGTVAK